MPEARNTTFAALVAYAKDRAVVLVRDDRITLEDGRFVLRAIEDLEADGVAIFPATTEVASGMERYLEARLGTALMHDLEIVSVH